MGEATSIEWTHHTFNPWWGCQRVSPGCENCYAEAFSKRIGGSPWAKGDHWGPSGLRTVASEKMWREPLKWDLAAQRADKRHRVFVASMADVFEDRDDLEPHRMRLFDLIQATPHLDWQVLTKRPENAVEWFGGTSGAGLDAPALHNLWMGTTVEDVPRVRRIDDLVQIPAAVHFVSCEPLLEDIADALAASEALDSIHWMIIGGESGHGSRLFDVAWARRLVRLCRNRGIAPFIKQLGAKAVDANLGIAGRSLGVDDDGAEMVTRRLTDAKGGDWNEWPPSLRIREFPEVRP